MTKNKEEHCVISKNGKIISYQTDITIIKCVHTKQQSLKMNKLTSDVFEKRNRKIYNYSW